VGFVDVNEERKMECNLGIELTSVRRATCTCDSSGCCGTGCVQNAFCHTSPRFKVGFRVGRKPCRADYKSDACSRIGSRLYCPGPARLKFCGPIVLTRDSSKRFSRNTIARMLQPSECFLLVIGFPSRSLLPAPGILFQPLVDFHPVRSRTSS
jgi:hypothetical protein